MEIWKGVIVGVVFGALNFWLLTQIVRGMTHSEKIKKWKLPVYFLLKIALLIGTIGLILQKGYVSPLPFLAGFTVSLVLGVSFKALRNSSGNSPERGQEDDGASL